MDKQKDLLNRLAWLWKVMPGIIGRCASKLHNLHTGFGVSGEL